MVPRILTNDVAPDIPEKPVDKSLTLEDGHAVSRPAQCRERSSEIESPCSQRVASSDQTVENSPTEEDFDRDAAFDEGRPYIISSESCSFSTKHVHIENSIDTPYHSLRVDDIGPSGKCSSFSWRVNPDCSQRTDKPYLDGLRAMFAANPSYSSQKLTNAERKLKKDEKLLYNYVVRRLGPRLKRSTYPQTCRTCGKNFNAWRNDRLGHRAYGCDYHPGTLFVPVSDEWSPETRERFNTEGPCKVSEGIDRGVSDLSDKNYREFMAWDCCRQRGDADGCKFGRHIGRGEEDNEYNRALRNKPRLILE